MIQYAEIAFNLPVPGTFTYEVPETASVGMRVQAKFRNRTEEGVIVGLHYNMPEYKTLLLDRIVDKKPVVNQEQIELAGWMSEYYLSSLGESIYKMIPAGRRRSKLEELPTERNLDPFLLNEEQEQAFEEIKSSFGKFSTHLLYGVTGSGKTEIYIHLIQEVLKQSSGSVILLVPEITLTFHVIKKLEKIFPNQIAVIHSALKTSDRFRSYLRVLEGKVRIVVGTRSAIFSPVQNLQLVIIDEEHDSSYKEHSSPRYHARQVAMERCRQGKSILVLGSATPSLEVYHNALEGKIQMHILKYRAGNAKPPKVRVVEEKNFNKLIGSDLTFAIRQRLNRHEQTVLLLNRRGYSPLVYSQNRKEYIPCPNCSTHLCYHRSGIVQCHLCGHRESAEELNQKYGEELIRVGFGTQRLEETLLEQFPEARIERLDQDSTQNKAILDEVISRLIAGEIDILTGTQMIAKGLDAAKVTLVGVLQATLGLGLPDFRANERIFSLLTQVSGRAGRADREGEVIIESSDSDNPIVQLALMQDYHKFYEAEILERKELWYPPFCRLIRIVARSEEEEASLEAIQSFSEILAEMKVEKSQILGPAPCPFYKINKNFRNHMIIKTLFPNQWKSNIQKALSETKLSKKVYLEVDPDPIDLI